MNITKKIVMLALLAQLSSAAVLARLEFVAIDRGQLLQSKEGRALQKEIAEDARQLQAKQQARVAEIQRKEQEFQKKARLLSPAAQQKEFKALEKESKQVQWQLEQETAGFRDEAEFKQKELDERNVMMAQVVAQEENWGAVGNVSELLYLTKEINKTDVVLARLDQEYEARIAAAQKTTPEAASSVISMAPEAAVVA